MCLNYKSTFGPFLWRRKIHKKNHILCVHLTGFITRRFVGSFNSLLFIVKEFFVILQIFPFLKVGLYT